MQNQECTFLASDLKAIWEEWDNAAFFDRMIAFPLKVYLSAWLFVVPLLVMFKNIFWGAKST